MISRAGIVAVTRRVGTAAVLLGAVLTVLIGGFFVYGASKVLDEEPVWAPILGAAGIFAAATGAVCAVLAARDLWRGSLTRRGEFWAWTATLALSLQWLSSVWFFWVAFVCPFITLAAVRMARGPLQSKSR